MQIMDTAPVCPNSWLATLPAVHVVCQTDLGSFTMAIMDKRAPQTARFFLGDVDAGAYNRTSVFRITGVVNRQADERHPIDVIQVGIPENRTDIPTIVAHESTRLTGLSHVRGAVSMPRYAPGAVYHSFFICMRDEPELDFGGRRHPDRLGFAAFGFVVDGFETVQRIYRHIEPVEYLSRSIEVVQVVRSPASLSYRSKTVPIS